MSLNLTPVSTPHDKPIPPSRSKRRSIPNPGSVSGSASGSGSGSRSPRVSSPSPGQRTPTQLSLERNEDDLARATRDEILDCLRTQWDERDMLLTRITEMEEREERCISEKSELGRALQAAQERLGTIYNEQSRLEADVEERDELLDRVRSRMGMIERDLRESQNRASNQERAFEAERTAFQTQEAHLNARIRQLQSSSSSSSTKLSRSPSSSEGLQEDLESLRISHATLLAQLDSLSRELHDTRTENVKLQEENEGWEFLIRERTFQGHLFHQHQEDSTDQKEGEGEGRPHLEALDEELELEMDDLNTELDAHSLMSDEETISRRSTLRGQAKRRAQPASRQTSINESSDPGNDTRGGGLGLDLATELGRAAEMSTGSTSRQVSRSGPLEATGEEGSTTGDQEELELENKRLKEELKAVQLYCSKILDRIIAQDGFEHILSVDYKTRRMGRSASGRGSLQDVVKMMHTEPSSMLTTPPASTPKAVARPISTMARMGSDRSSTPKPDVSAPGDNKSEKRARRGWSLDLRTFGFGTGGITSSSAASATPVPAAVSESKQPLRTLTLKASPATASSSKLPAVPGGRKLEPQAEDEEDKRERHRLEAALKLMGISKPSDPFSDHISPPRPPPPPPSSVPALPGRQSARRSNSSSVRNSNSGTPLSRLSSALGFTDPPPSQSELPSDPDPSPEKVDAVLREYDQRESARRVSLSKGKAEGGYTSPPRLSSMRRHTDNEMQKTGKGGSGGHKGRESISTLWSLGDTSTDSPPR